MTESEGLADGFSRLPDLVRGAVAGLTAEQLRWAPAPGANTIGWLIWHLTRIQDHHLADILDQPQIWESGDWARDIGIDADPDNTGYAHTAQQIAQIRPTSPAALTDYYDAVHARTLEFLSDVPATDFTKVVDEAWDPPVTMRVRLVSILSDDLQHAGQAAYIRGLLPTT